jgi:hypothetical protein
VTNLLQKIGASAPCVQTDLPTHQAGASRRTSPRDKQIAVIGALSEDMRTRSVERLTGIHCDTVMRLGTRIGRALHGHAGGQIWHQVLVGPDAAAPARSVP